MAGGGGTDCNTALCKRHMPSACSIASVAHPINLGCSGSELSRCESPDSLAEVVKLRSRRRLERHLRCLRMLQPHRGVLHALSAPEQSSPRDCQHFLLSADCATHCDSLKDITRSTGVSATPVML